MMCIYVLSQMQLFYIPGVVETVKFWIAKGTLYYLLINLIREEEDFKHTFWAVVIATSGLIVYGWNIYVNHPELLCLEDRVKGFGEYNESNGLGLLLTVAWPLGFFLLETETGILKKALLIAFLIASFVTLAYTKSRGSLLGFGTAVTLCIIFSRNLFKSKIVKMFGMIGLGCAISSFVLVILFTRGVTSFSGSDGEASANNRLMAWHAAIHMTMDHPLLGVGWGSFTDHCREYGMDTVMIVHNTPLNVLVETGVFGLFAYLSYMLITLKQLFAIRRSIGYSAQYEYLYPVTCGVLIGLLCFNINTMFSVKDHDQTLWILLGLGGAVCGAYNKMIEGEGERVNDSEGSDSAILS